MKTIPKFLLTFVIAAAAIVAVPNKASAQQDSLTRNVFAGTNTATYVTNLVAPAEYTLTPPTHASPQLGVGTKIATAGTVTTNEYYLGFQFAFRKGDYPTNIYYITNTVNSTNLSTITIPNENARFARLSRVVVHAATNASYVSVTLFQNR